MIKDNLEKKIFIKRVELLFHHYYIGFLSAFATAVVTVVVLWEILPTRDLLIWFACLSTILILRFYIVYSNKKPKEELTYKYWRKLYLFFLITAFIQGAIWGMLGTILFPPNLKEYQAFVIVVLAGMSAGALPLMFHIKEVFVAFVTPILFPFAIYMVFIDSKVYLAISFLTLYYFAGMFFVARRGEISLEETIRLRFENDSLIEDMKMFSYTLSHDLKAPLRTINGFAQLLSEDIQDRNFNNMNCHLEKVIDNGQRMNGLIDSILTMYRLSNDEMAVETVNLSSLALESIAALKANEPNRDVTVKIQNDLIVTGDKNLLCDVVDNLIGNAWKYTGKVDKALIEFSLNDEGYYCVRDNGDGFDMKHADKLFQIFGRLHSNNEFPGNGIGLASTARIIERHNGNIWANCENGETSFYFSLNL